MIHEPLHPGEIVKEACIHGTGLSVTDAAKKLDVDRTTFSRLINGHSGISPEMAMRLSIALNTSVEMWLNLQRNYDIWQVKKRRSEFHVKKLAA